MQGNVQKFEQILGSWKDQDWEMMDLEIQKKREVAGLLKRGRVRRYLCYI